MDKVREKIPSSLRLIGHPCPFCKATTCYEFYNCNGCETHAEYIQELIKTEKEKVLDEVLTTIQEDIPHYYQKTLINKIRELREGK